MSNREIETRLKKALAARSPAEPPDFDSVWSDALQRHRMQRRRYKVVSGIAATLAAVAIVVGTWPHSTPDAGDEFLIAEALMNQTGWTAPSDALLPQHQFDIYQELPSLLESTDIEEGSLL